jgi:transposase-like protein
MPHKSKILPELKIQAVESYLAGKISYGDIVKQYEISDSTLYDWIRLYKSRGPEGLIPKAHNQIYSKELKLQVINEYQSGQSSLRSLCSKYYIANHKTIRGWLKRYNGHEELKSNDSGGEIYMTKGRTTSLEERIEIVHFCIENGNDYRHTIEKYNVSYQQIYSWIKKCEKSGVEGLADHRGKRKDKDAMTELEKANAENRLLEAENKRLRMENDLLKKLEEIERRRY